MFKIIAPNSPRDHLQTYRQGGGGRNAFALSQDAHPDVASQGRWWAHKGSNLGPLPCEGNALPLSYAPGIFVRDPSLEKSASDRTICLVRARGFTKCGLSVSSWAQQSSRRAVRHNAILSSRIKVS